MGGPEKQKDVFGFLFRLFNDPLILRTPFFIRIPLAAGIAFFRTRRSRSLYALLGGGSPIRKNTQAQAEALQKKLGEKYHCRIGALYAAPFVEDVVQEIKNEGIREIILLPMYPQCSTTTTKPALKRVLCALKKESFCERIETIDALQTLSGFIAALTENFLIEMKKAEGKGRVKVLFSAHGLPESVVRSGDTYPLACLATAQAVVEKSGYKNLDWTLCYQSRFGPVRWTRPFLVDEIDKAAKEKRPLIIVPVAFFCEHLETLVELDIDMKKRALCGGAPFFGRAGTPACHEGFIKALAEQVKKQS